jgi:flagellar motor protein MotB
MNAKGESDPAASNATEEGRKENRRVQIVAKKG